VKDPREFWTMVVCSCVIVAFLVWFVAALVKDIS
jgi:hypothetical protein